MNKAPMLYDDLITEILSKLPVKSLLRFRCVCKSWELLISDSTFVKLHLQRSPKHANILLYRDYPLGYYKTFVVSYSVPSLFENHSVAVTKHGYVSQMKGLYRIVGSCNGLVCLRKTRSPNTHWVRFWNPAMGLRSKNSPFLTGSACLTALTRFGFGYDDSSDCYKVVAVMLKSNKTEVKVHCMGDTCWRMIAILPSFPILTQIDGLLVSGTVNWVAIRRSGFDYRWSNVSVKELEIFSFHLGKNTFKHLPFPEGIAEVPLTEPKIVVLRDCLCLFLIHNASHYVLWQMKEFGVEKSWTRLAYLKCAAYAIPIPLCLYDNDDMVLLYRKTNRAIFHLYNLRDDRVVRVQEDPTQYLSWRNAMEYVPSLVLPC